MSAEVSGEEEMMEQVPAMQAELEEESKGFMQLNLSIEDLLSKIERVREDH